MLWSIFYDDVAVLSQALTSRALYPDRDLGDRWSGYQHLLEAMVNSSGTAHSLPVLGHLARRFAAEPRNLYAALMAAERFARKVGTRQIGPSSRKLISG